MQRLGQSTAGIRMRAVFRNKGRSRTKCQALSRREILKCTSFACVQPYVAINQWALADSSQQQQQQVLPSKCVAIPNTRAAERYVMSYEVVCTLCVSFDWQEIHVGQAGQQYATIQQAIDAAPTGSRVLIHPGK